MSEIKQAVSDEIWAQAAAAGGSANLDSAVGDRPDVCAYLVAMNNAALPDGDARQFTWDDVDALRYFTDVKKCGAIGDGVTDDTPAFQRAALVASTVARIAALLPPREKA